MSYKYPWYAELDGCGCECCRAYVNIMVWCDLPDEDAAKAHYVAIVDPLEIDAYNKFASMIAGPNGYAIYKMMLARGTISGETKEVALPVQSGAAVEGL